MSDYSKYDSLFASSAFSALAADPNGRYWLKLRSIGRKKLMLQFAAFVHIDVSRVKAKALPEYIFEKKPPEKKLEQFIREAYKSEREIRRGNEEALVSQLYRMQDLNWGGLHQNSLEQTIVNNYVKKISDWDELNSAIDEKLLQSMRGYVRCSWYNHWTSIIIEDIFKDHRSVLPTIGLMKQVDFFINEVPFDLKVTYFPEGFMSVLRTKAGLRKEFAELTSCARKLHIVADNKATEAVQCAELLARLSDHPSRDARTFIADFKKTRRNLIEKTVRDPSDLLVWLYEKQGFRRFDASNRLFLILVDLEDLSSSWKLKRCRENLVGEVNNHLETLAHSNREQKLIEFTYDKKKYSAYADVLFVLK